MPPLWPLKDFVAVNPFLGLSRNHFLEAAARLRRVAHGEILMTPEYYEEKIASGELSQEHLAAVLTQSKATFPSPWKDHLPMLDLDDLEAQLRHAEGRDCYHKVLTFAECLDLHHGRQKNLFIIEEISKWCSVYYDEGQSSWRMPWRHLPLFEAWREAALLDHNPSINGWSHFHATIRSLPDNPDAIICTAMERLQIPRPSLEEYLHRSLMTVSGWGSYIQCKVREDGMRGNANPSLKEFLAIRLSYDLALHAQYMFGQGVEQAWRDSIKSLCRKDPQLDLLPRYLAHLSLEVGYQSEIKAKLKNGFPSVGPKLQQKSLQAVFCIDVRSEIYRRHLEAQSDAISTIGFAGFFGMPINYIPFGRKQALSQCPVLLLPQYQVSESLLEENPEAERGILQNMAEKSSRHDAWNAFKTSAITCFSFVETTGLLFGIKLLKESLKLKGREGVDHPPATPDLKVCGHNNNASGIGLKDRIALAEGALRGMGLTIDFARLVLICGHGSTTANNPYGAGLDCGACGGHAGDANARVAALILNDPDVRAGLKETGIFIPEETLFLAGLHDTTTDAVSIQDPDKIPDSHREDLGTLQEFLQAASQATREERAPRLGLQSGKAGVLAKAIEKRSRDWSQIRPEWGLANNAAFIVADRKRTKGTQFHGRTFLHDYDKERDHDGKILELIMTAPMIVTSWINLQYFASTVNNPLFGSGNKTIHNVVGNLGIWQGNGGDLQVGLPMQSLHDGSQWMHEPLRLSVFIEASRESIDRVLGKHPNVADLVSNQWIHLFNMDSQDGAVHQSDGRGGWLSKNQEEG